MNFVHTAKDTVATDGHRTTNGTLKFIDRFTWSPGVVNIAEARLRYFRTASVNKIYLWRWKLSRFSDNLIFSERKPNMWDIFAEMRDGRHNAGFATRLRDGWHNDILALFWVVVNSLELLLWLFDHLQYAVSPSLQLLLLHAWLNGR